MKRILLIATLIFWAASAQAASNWYVDSSVSSSGNGQSWATAWKNVTNASGLSAGDTVYISGGSTFQSYSVSGWVPTSGSSGNPITWAVGQDAGHNGTVIFTGGTVWLGSSAIHDVTINGNVNGANHISVQNYSNYIWQPSAAVSSIKLKYIDFPGMVGGFYMANGTCSNLEWDHCMLEKTGTSNMHDNIWFAMDGSGFDSFLIHHCAIYIPVKSTDSGLGDDMLQWGSGVSFYNNYVKAVFGTYTYTQHADMFQISGNYFKIYNNYFEDVGESIVYIDPYSAPTNIHDVYFYNNVLAWSHAKSASGYPRGLDFQPENNGVGSTFTNVIVANNTFVDWNGALFLIRYNNAASYTNCYVKNNIFKNGSGLALDPGVVESNDTTGNVQFIRYAQYAVSTNDLRLSGSDTVAKDKGAALSSTFAVDKDGVSRPQGSAWDIGAYEFITGGAIAKPMPPTLLLVN